MATVTRGKTFAGDGTVENTGLHSLVDDAAVSDIVNADVKSTAAIDPEKSDDHSANVAEMQETADPGEDGTESLATSLRDEIKRLRFMLKEYGGKTYWYESLASVVATVTGTETLTNKTIDGDNNTISNLAHGAEVDEPSSGVHGATGTVVGTSDTQTLTNKVIDGYNNTVSNLAHGAEVDEPSSGVHGVTGSVVGTTDTQTLSSKTHTDPVLNGTLSGTAFLDQDDMSDDSAIAVSSQQAIAAYVNARGEGHICVGPHAYSGITAGTWAFAASGSTWYGGHWANSSAADNDQIDYKVWLDVGTYSFAALHFKAASYGILDLIIGSSQGTIDMYNGSTTFQNVSTISSITVTTAGLKTVSLKANGKNASSSGYKINVQAMTFYRTA